MGKNNNKLNGCLIELRTISLHKNFCETPAKDEELLRESTDERRPGMGMRDPWEGITTDLR